MAHSSNVPSLPFGEHMTAFFLCTQYKSLWVLVANQMFLWVFTSGNWDKNPACINCWLQNLHFKYDPVVDSKASMPPTPSQAPCVYIECALTFAPLLPHKGGFFYVSAVHLPYLWHSSHVTLRALTSTPLITKFADLQHHKMGVI